MNTKTIDIFYLKKKIKNKYIPFWVGGTFKGSMRIAEKSDANVYARKKKKKRRAAPTAVVYYKCRLCSFNRLLIPSKKQYKTCGETFLTEARERSEASSISQAS